MLIRECYEIIGADYEDAIGRMMKDERIVKFAGMFLKDTSFPELKEAMQREDYNMAFRMAHTLKGVCQNLSFTALYEPVQEITEALREKNRDIELAKSLFPRVEEEYERTTAGIKDFLQNQ